MSLSEASADRVWALIEEIQVAMVVTHDDHGDRLRARPIAAHPAREENAIYFLTDVDAGKVDEVSQNDNVCLGCCHGNLALAEQNQNGFARLQAEVTAAMFGALRLEGSEVSYGR